MKCGIVNLRDCVITIEANIHFDKRQNNSVESNPPSHSHTWLDVFIYSEAILIFSMPFHLASGGLTYVHGVQMTPASSLCEQDRRLLASR